MLKNTTLPDLLLTLGAIALLFFIGRAVILWYYKIDERIALQKETNFLLQKLVDKASETSPEEVKDNRLNLYAKVDQVKYGESNVNNPEALQDALNKYKK